MQFSAYEVSIPGLQLEGMDSGPITNVLCLMNMVTIDELKDDEEYEGKDAHMYLAL